MLVRDIMTSPAITVTPENTVKSAAKLLAANGFTALPVVTRTGDLVGIVTEGDLVRDRFPSDPRYRHADGCEIAGSDERPQVPPATVGAVMSASVTSSGAATDVVDLVILMLREHRRSMPVLDGSQVVGVVTRRDLVAVLARDDRRVATDIRHQLTMYGGPDRWTVEVHDGAVAIVDRFDSATDRHVAAELAEAVPGSIATQVTSLPAGD